MPWKELSDEQWELLEVIIPKQYFKGLLLD